MSASPPKADIHHGDDGVRSEVKCCVERLRPPPKAEVSALTRPPPCGPGRPCHKDNTGEQKQGSENPSASARHIGWSPDNVLRFERLAASYPSCNRRSSE